MGLKNVWIDDKDYDAIYAEVTRRKAGKHKRISCAEVLHEWLQERRLYVGAEEGHQVNEGPGAAERTEE